MNTLSSSQSSHLKADPKQILADYKMGFLNRQLSILARKEVALGRAGFAILGDGVELPQIAMAKVFEPGDWRSGYYRDQTFMLASGALSCEQFFAQIYAHSDISHEPSSGGRQMNGHFASRFYHHNQWQDQTQMINVAADMSCTAGQLPRLIGLGASSNYYHQLSQQSVPHHWMKKFSRHGREVVFGTIGDAATSEGHFWETINAMGVLQIPVVLSVWDNGYGISVPTRLQTTKGSLAQILPGFCTEGDLKGINFYHVKGWDYPELINTYQQATDLCRNHRQPCMILVDELTQPLGHSSSGSHERYKSKDRIQWEKDHDGLMIFKQWILRNTSITAQQLSESEDQVIKQCLAAKESAYEAYQAPMRRSLKQLKGILNDLDRELKTAQISVTHRCVYAQITATAKELFSSPNESLSQTTESSLSYEYVHTSDSLCPFIHQQHNVARQIIRRLKQLQQSTGLQLDSIQPLIDFEQNKQQWGEVRYRTHLVSQTHPQNEIAATYENTQIMDGRQIIRDYFHLKCQNPRVIIIGEDVGHLGGVNLEFEGLKQDYPHQVIDTGIRELTIVGQGHGMAMRGLRPVVDIQYLDYLLFGLQVLSDDVASLHYRSAGGQVSPVIIRTKGHRLMGIWHSGSPMAMILHACRGIHLCVPRNMSQACGMYETLFHGDDPGLVIEPMNGYRKKEPRPTNLGEYNIVLGTVEILRTGHHITIATYGACCAIVLEAAQILADDHQIETEVIDCRTLHPFDTEQQIAASVCRTHSLIIVDEDVPGGASATILNTILSDHQAFQYLDTPPITINAVENRPAYSADGDYYCKPQAADVIDHALKIMEDKHPNQFLS